MMGAEKTIESEGAGKIKVRISVDGRRGFGARAEPPTQNLAGNGPTLCNCCAHSFHHIYSHLIDIYFSPPIICEGMMENNRARGSQEKPKYGSASMAAGALGCARSPRHKTLRAMVRRYVIVVHIYFIIYTLTYLTFTSLRQLFAKV